MRVAVTGANGFLGHHLAASLATAGHEVVALSIERGALPSPIAFVEVDVRDRAGVERALTEVAPDAVVHLAALSHVGESWRRIADYYAINVVGTENVARAARGRRLLFASSAEVYGVVPESEQPIVESRPPAPRSPYAMTKAFAERIVLDAGGIVVRSFNLVGPGQLTTFALPGFAAQLAAIARRPAHDTAPPVLAVGNLGARRDFVDVHAAVAGYRLLLERGVPGTIYNLASGRAPSIAEMLDRLRAVAGVEARVEHDPARERPVDVPILAGDAGRLRALGWCPDPGGLERALGELWGEALERAERTA